MSKTPGNRAEPNGFALIVTISMMVLLVLLGVGLLSLSVITLRGSNQSDARQIARSNARLALVIAIGELQKAVGPDQRITATADIAAASGGSELGSGQPPRNDASLDGTLKGLSPVQAGTRRWTGVFTNRDTPDKIYRKTPAVQMQRWMVSGNEQSKDRQPANTPALQACAVNGGGQVADPSAAVVVVGENSAGAGNLDDFVAVPLVSVRQTKNGGFAGAFGYWVGDEGVKSRIDIARENEDPESYASISPQRRGWETVEGFEDYPLPVADADEALSSLPSLPSAELLIPSAGQGNPSPRQSVFHSATTESSGVISNTLEGGLRVDLSAALGAELPTEAPAGSYDNYPIADGSIISKAVFSRLTKLKWDHLAEFYRKGSELSSGELLVEDRSADDEAAIAPVISDFRLLFGVRLESIRQGNAETGRYKVLPCGKFAVSIANPYSLPLRWERNLEFELKNMTPSGNSPSRIWQFGAPAAFIPANGSMDSPSNERAVFNQAVFRIKPGVLEPGEARAYTIASKVERPYDQSTRRVDVDLVPFVSASPFDFSRCVEMQGPAETTLPKSMDIRESWQTTLVGLEMRLGSSGSSSNRWLRRIEGFELDNGYFGPNTRRFDSNNVRNLRGPVGLMLYSFQISQPGMDYGNLMPNGYELGQRSSTLRTYADFNVRATNTHKAIASYNPPPYFMESNDSISQLPFEPGGQTGQGFTRNLVADPLFWGHTSESGSNKVVLFSYPKQFSSLAQLQHADLTVDEVTRSVGHQPGNAFGNSYAPPFVKRELVEQERTDYVLIGRPNQSGTFQTKRRYFDISHILNSSLWDRYFFSSIGSGETVAENPAMVVSADASAEELSDPSIAAGQLTVTGAFNVNSTDKNAWKALLASSKYFSHPAEDSDILEAAFPRSLEQPEGHELPPTGEGKDSFAGYRRLSDEELDALAAEIVLQVRRRGPFVSLSHFVNRALSPIGAEKELARSGALQSALDESGVNISMDGRENGFDDLVVGEERVTLPSKENAPRADLDGGDRGGRPASTDPSHPDWATTSRDNNFGSVASILADQEMLKTAASGRAGVDAQEQGFRSTGIPAWVTQADVLQAIGSVISARSDTFRIRACGQARNASGEVVATAYCEAVVQRQPDYVEVANRPHERGDVLTQNNKIYGRKLEIVSFRWLSPLEI